MDSLAHAQPANFRAGDIEYSTYNGWVVFRIIFIKAKGDFNQKIF